MRPAIYLLVLAIASCIIEHIYNACRSKKVKTPIMTQDRIFIGIVVTNPILLAKTIEYWFNSANIPERVYIGVIEYVTSEMQSLSNFISVKNKNNVRIYTTNKKKFVHINSSRKFLLKLQRNEKYTLFIP